MLIKVCSFYDGFAYQNNEQPATVNAMQLLNMPMLTQMPQFWYIQALFNDTEGSKTLLSFLEHMNDVLEHFSSIGVRLWFLGYGENMFVPKTNRKLNDPNGHHL